eukprot:gene5339-6649_t
MAGVASPETGLITLLATRGGRAHAGNAVPARPLSSHAFLLPTHPHRRGSTMSSSTLSHSAAAVPLSKRLAIAIGASLLGLSLVYFAGFSHIEASATVIKRIAQTAGFAGLFAAIVLTLLQSLWVTPLILHAETFENS